MLPASAQLAQTHSPLPPSPVVWPSAGLESSRLDHLLGRMTSTTLAELDAVALLNRVDTKFLLTSAQLVELLPALGTEYRVLEVLGKRLHQYRTLYFDTPDLELYRLHQAGRPIRHKVRSRAYVDSGLAFFEIKSKTRDNRTIKHRLATSALVTTLTPETRAFVTGHLGPGARSLQPTLSNDFLRVTLMDRCQTERLTLDLHVQFDCDGRTAVLPGVVIAELKQGAVDQRSAFAHAMRAARIGPSSLSKYCAGARLLVSDMEHEAAEKMLATIERLTHADSADRLPITLDRTASRM